MSRRQMFAGAAFVAIVFVAFLFFASPSGDARGAMIGGLVGGVIGKMVVARRGKMT